jgi:hypothetical protein
MNFQQKIADFILANRTTSQHPDIALTGMNQQLESESMIILAGMNQQENSFELEQYFEQMLTELQFERPSKMEAAKTLIDYYLKVMISEPEQAFDLMTKIQNDIDDSFDWPQQDTTKCLGEELGLEHLYTWYRELQDLEDGSVLFYYNDLPQSEQKKKFKQHLIEEADKWLKANKIYS